MDRQIDPDIYSNTYTMYVFDKKEKFDEIAKFYHLLKKERILNKWDEKFDIM